MIELTDLQNDVLKEMFNLGAGNAAAALSEMMSDEEILLSVPEVRFLPLNELVIETKRDGSSQLCGVSQKFDGAISGEAIMLYSEEESLLLVRRMVGSLVPVEHIKEMESEALAEVGNIVLNACLSAFGDLFEDEITTELPEVTIGSHDDVVTLSGKHQLSEKVLYLRTRFSLSTAALVGHIGFFLTSSCLEKLGGKLDAYVERALCA
ncbi:MAG: hypothetical protein GY822_10455 [Deltaproteobacteria bacterium]|nr:hypothetical protein [Deltaproteobacteria bacterium]